MLYYWCQLFLRNIRTLMILSRKIYKSDVFDRSCTLSEYD